MIRISVHPVLSTLIPDAHTDLSVYLGSSIDIADARPFLMSALTILETLLELDHANYNTVDSALESLHHGMAFYSDGIPVSLCIIRHRLKEATYELPIPYTIADFTPDENTKNSH